MESHFGGILQPIKKQVDLQLILFSVLGFKLDKMRIDFYGFFVGTLSGKKICQAFGWHGNRSII
jgi:hypothetical protein